MPDIADFALNFEAEHIFAQSMWDIPEVKALFDANGYVKNSIGNLMAEYSDADAVRFIQDLPDSDPLKRALLDPESSAGIVRHKGNASGGSQFGKNTWLAEELTNIANSNASASAKTAALNNLFDWTWKLAKGLIVGPDGQPLGVMGNTEFADILRDAFHNGPQAGYVDPLNIDNIDSLPEAERLATQEAINRAAARETWWQKPENAVEFSNSQGAFNGRGRLAMNVVESLFKNNLLTALEKNDALIELGTGRNSAAASRVMVRVTALASARATTFVGEVPELAGRVIEEVRAAMQVSAAEPNSASDEVLERELVEVQKQMVQEALNKGVLRSNIEAYGSRTWEVMSRTAEGIARSRFASGRRCRSR